MSQYFALIQSVADQHDADLRREADQYRQARRTRSASTGRRTARRPHGPADRVPAATACQGSSATPRAI